MKRFRYHLIVAGLMALATIGAGGMAQAQTNCAVATTYEYDELGRLVQMDATNEVSEDYAYDPAGNRTSQVVTRPTIAVPVIVVPLNGFTIIPLPLPEEESTCNETAPSFSVAGGSATEGGQVTFTVTKTGTVTQTYDVSYATSSGTATSGTDFTAASGPLSFSSVETSKPVEVTTLQDSTYEGDETFTLSLSNPTNGATIASGQGTATGTIDEDDPPPIPSTILTTTAGAVLSAHTSVYSSDVQCFPNGFPAPSCMVTLKLVASGTTVYQRDNVLGTFINAPGYSLTTLPWEISVEDTLRGVEP